MGARCCEALLCGTALYMDFPREAPLIGQGSMATNPLRVHANMYGAKVCSCPYDILNKPGGKHARTMIGPQILSSLHIHIRLRLPVFVMYI